MTLHTGGLPETTPSGFPGHDDLTRRLTDRTLAGRTASPEDVGPPGC